MKEEMNTTKPARAKDLASLLRNPLVIFGLILLAGDGPLLIAYLLTSNLVHKGILLGTLLVFILGMGATFCYLVIYKPRNLFSPEEIPEKAYGKSLYSDSELIATLALPGAADKPDKEPESPGSEILKAVINNVQESLCWFLLKVANKEIRVGVELRDAIIKETELYDLQAGEIDATNIALGYFFGLRNFDGLLFDYDVDTEQDTITFKLSTEALDLIWQRLNPETANSS